MLWTSADLLMPCALPDSKPVFVSLVGGCQALIYLLARWLRVRTITHSTGPYCDVCRDGWFMTGSAGCDICPEGSLGELFKLLFAFLFLCIAGAMTLFFLAMWLRRFLEARTEKKRLRKAEQVGSDDDDSDVQPEDEEMAGGATIQHGAAARYALPPGKCACVSWVSACVPPSIP